MNKYQKHPRIILATLLLITVSLSCNFLSSDNPTPTPTPTLSPDIAVGSSGEEGNEPENENETEENQNPPESEGQSQDSCLVAVWAVDPDSMSTYLSSAMNQSSEVLFVVSQVSGDLFLYFDNNGEMGTSSEDFQIIVSLDAGLSEVSFEFTFILEASGTAQYSANGTTITNWDQDYEFVGDPLSAIGEISSGESTIVIAINPGWFVGLDYDGGDEATATYACSGNTLTLIANEYGTIVFSRIE
ncbi:MAG: hypothetical protein FVQ83_16980 [Chloroflexi bacterium]|nr:hypothetical protein [Chloroflexota bacterium]